MFFFSKETRALPEEIGPKARAKEKREKYNGNLEIPSEDFGIQTETIQRGPRNQRARNQAIVTRTERQEASTLEEKHFRLKMPFPSGVLNKRG